jgi:hypothetical protein
MTRECLSALVVPKSQHGRKWMALPGIIFLAARMLLIASTLSPAGPSVGAAMATTMLALLQTVFDDPATKKGPARRLNLREYGLETQRQGD